MACADVRVAVRGCRACDGCCGHSVRMALHADGTREDPTGVLERIARACDGRGARCALRRTCVVMMMPKRCRGALRGLRAWRGAVAALCASKSVVGLLSLSEDLHVCRLTMEVVLAAGSGARGKERSLRKKRGGDVRSPYGREEEELRREMKQFVSRWGADPAEVRLL